MVGPPGHAHKSNSYLNKPARRGDAADRSNAGLARLSFEILVLSQWARLFREKNLVVLGKRGECDFRPPVFGDPKSFLNFRNEFLVAVPVFLHFNSVWR